MNKWQLLVRRLELTNVCFWVECATTSFQNYTRLDKRSVLLVAYSLCNG